MFLIIFPSFRKRKIFHHFTLHMERFNWILYILKNYTNNCYILKILQQLNLATVKLLKSQLTLINYLFYFIGNNPICFKILK